MTADALILYILRIAALVLFILDSLRYLGVF